MNLLDAALKYARRGWRVLPLHSPVRGGCSCGRDACESPAKHPWTGRGLKEAATGEKTIKNWWLRWPYANIGISIPDDMVVVDVDGPEGDAALKQAGVRLVPTV